MSEKKARYLSLILIGIEVILILALPVYFLLAFSSFGLGRTGKTPPFEVIIVLLIFLVVGILLIASLYSKKYYHILTIWIIAVLGYIIIYMDFQVEAFLFSIAALLPQILYYMVAFRKKIRKKS